MRRQITKTQLVNYITRLDTRCKKYDEDKFDDLIDDAFSELNSIQGLFHDEDTLDVSQYVSDGVVKMSYDIEKDVTYIYDAFLSLDSQTPHLQSDKMVQVDPRVMGRVNIDFSSEEDMYNSYTYHEQSGTDFENSPTSLVVKYYYVPTSEFDEIYMNRDIYKALREALAAVTYFDLHDGKKAALHLQRMEMLANGITVIRPHDFADEPRLQRFVDGC